ncbi:MAG: lipoprotein insertase outer membrane protein LolB [Xanthomonadales bacterium]|nr:lipoprotein insertase outer membrane protein LolB [Xanthomonadales bacterium]
MPRFRLLTALAAALVLASCASARRVGPSSEAGLEQYRQRAEQLRAVDTWHLSGRLSVDDGEEGGSGTLQWQIAPGAQELSFRGALGRGAWQIHAQPGRAVLGFAAGRVVEAETVEELVYAELGWGVPVQALRWWVVGLADHGPHEALRVDDNGDLVELDQHNWQVSFDRYREFDGHRLPGRIEAKQGARRVKLALAKWTAGADGS